MSKKTTTYFSIDIETDGPCPGLNSILSLGCVAFDEQGNNLDTYYVNLDLLPEANPDPKTMDFWAQHQKYYDETRVWCQSPEEAMPHFSQWVASFPGSPVAVCMPSGFDFTWVYYYLMRFTGKSVFSFSVLDMKTMAMCMLRLPYRESVKRNWPRHWFSKLPHTHNALADSLEQAETFKLMLKDLMGSDDEKA